MGGDLGGGMEAVAVFAAMASFIVVAASGATTSSPHCTSEGVRVFAIGGMGKITMPSLHVCFP